jgi:hypothetical protein
MVIRLQPDDFGIFPPAVTFPGVDDAPRISQRAALWLGRPKPDDGAFVFTAVATLAVSDDLPVWIRVAARRPSVWLDDSAFVVTAALTFAISDDLPLSTRLVAIQRRLYPDEGAFIFVAAPTLAVSDDLPLRARLAVIQRRLYPEEGQLAQPLGPVSDDPFVRRVYILRRPQIWIDDSIIFVVPGVGQILDDQPLWRLQPAARKARFPWQTGDEFLALPLTPPDDPAPPVYVRLRSRWARVFPTDWAIIVPPAIGLVLDDAQIPTQRRGVRPSTPLLLDDGMTFVFVPPPSIQADDAPPLPIVSAIKQGLQYDS